MARKKQKPEKDFIDQILDSIDFRGLTQDEVAGKNGLIKQLSGSILQRALDASNLWFAMTHHLGYEKNSNAGDNSGNSQQVSFGKPERRHPSSTGSEQHL